MRGAGEGVSSVLIRFLNELVSGRSARRPVAVWVFPHHPNAEKRAQVMNREVDGATGAE